MQHYYDRLFIKLVDYSAVNVHMQGSPKYPIYAKRKPKEPRTAFGTKQRVIHRLHNRLKISYKPVLLKKDAKGANSVRIQAKNKSTLERLEQSLEELEQSVGKFQGVRVTMAVQKGSLKKGVNVLVQFSTVKQAFEAIVFMKDRGFKAQTVIPRRLRKEYGMTDDGEDVNIPVTKVPVVLHLPLAPLPRDLPKKIRLEHALNKLEKIQERDERRKNEQQNLANNQTQNEHNEDSAKENEDEPAFTTSNDDKENGQDIGEPDAWGDDGLWEEVGPCPPTDTNSKRLIKNKNETSEIQNEWSKEVEDGPWENPMTSEEVSEHDAPELAHNSSSENTFSAADNENPENPEYANYQTYSWKPVVGSYN